VAQRVSPYIAVGSGIRQLADADAIEDYPYHSVKSSFAVLHSVTLPRMTE
jgi:hypothetical protein